MMMIIIIAAIDKFGNVVVNTLTSSLLYYWYTRVIEYENDNNNPCDKRGLLTIFHKQSNKKK